LPLQTLAGQQIMRLAFQLPKYLTFIDLESKAAMLQVTSPSSLFCTSAE